MLTDWGRVIADAAKKLRNPETGKKRVRELFQIWWERAWYMLHSIRWNSMTYSPVLLRFYGKKLRKAKIVLSERGMRPLLEDDK